MTSQREDPLMPSKIRFPMVSGTIDHSDEQPSQLRPFALRRAPAVTPSEAKHRTVSGPTKIPQKTPRDNAMDDDAYTVPDD